MSYTPLDLVESYIGRFVAYPSEHALVAHTLWIAHTHLMDRWESTPRIAFNSPERGSGKTRALEVTEPLVPNPVHAVNVTPAYLFRKVGDDETGRPTILYDEVDTLFDSKVRDTGEVRGLLNAGHRRGAVAGRCICVGQKVMTEEIPAYCAVALAGLGNLPDTVASRSILIDMRRRAPDEHVEQFRHRIHAAQGETIRQSLADWCAELGVAADPEMPPGIEDRDADCWEPLLAIADAARGDWPKRAREAAIALVARSAERTQTTGVQLLSDLYDVFGGEEKLSTETILQRLHGLPESAWADIYGKPLNDRGLSMRLRKYGVKPKVTPPRAATRLQILMTPGGVTFCPPARKRNKRNSATRNKAPHKARSGDPQKTAKSYPLLRMLRMLRFSREGREMLGMRLMLRMQISRSVPPYSNTTLGSPVQRPRRKPRGKCSTRVSAGAPRNRLAITGNNGRPTHTRGSGLRARW